MLKNNNLHKINNSSFDVIVVDGFWGSGKSLLSPIMQCLQNVELYKINPIYEYLSILDNFNKISNDSSKFLLNRYLLMDQYNNLIGREINTKIIDDTSIFKNLNTLKYLKRIFNYKKNEEVLDEANKRNIALNLMTHNIVLTPNLFFQNIKNLKFIYILRNPVYIFDHFYNAMQRFDQERELELSILYKENNIPWFWNYDPNEYIKLSWADRTAMIINDQYKTVKKNLENLTKFKNFLILDFDDIVLNTNKSMKTIEQFTKRKFGKKINRTLKKLKIPRNNLSSGTGQFVKNVKGFKNLSEEENLERLMNLIKKQLKLENFKYIEESDKIFQEIKNKYIKNYFENLSS